VLPVSGSNFVTGPAGIDYRAGWQAQNSAIVSHNVSSFTNVTAFNESYTYLRLDFNPPANSNTWGFRLGLDAGYGAALYLDGAQIAYDSRNLWWQNSWANTGELITSTNLAVLAGSHIFEAYWAEDCCSGSSSAEFTTDGINWSPIATPIPAAAWLFGSGLAGLIGIGRRKKSTMVVTA